jgi:hypothetical protein
MAAIGANACVFFMTCIGGHPSIGSLRTGWFNPQPRGCTEGTSLAVLSERGLGGVSKESVTTNIVNMTARGHFQRLAKVTRHFHDGGAIRGT